VAFRSKVDWWLAALVIVAAEFGPASVWISGEPFPFWLALSTTAILVLIAVLLVPIRYILEGRTVRIRCGVPQWQFGSFAVDEVQSVRPTHNPLSSPALSLDRLRVDAGMNTWLISPKDKRGFLKALVNLDAGLQFDGECLVRRAVQA
jgi:hypothetical protein